MKDLTAVRRAVVDVLTAALQNVGDRRVQEALQSLASDILSHYATPSPDMEWQLMNDATVRAAYEMGLRAATGSGTSEREARRIVDEQADDEALWFKAATITEAYLQEQLRRLHAAVERETGGETGPAAAVRRTALATQEGRKDVDTSR